LEWMEVLLEVEVPYVGKLVLLNHFLLQSEI
jgi:hypothetical protein